MEHFELIKRRERSLNNGKYIYKIIDNHRRYSAGEVALPLICKLFSVEIDDAISMIKNANGGISNKDAKVYFLKKEDADIFLFELQKRAISLLVNGVIRYERF